MSGDEIKPRIVYVLTRKDKADDDDTDIYVGSTLKSLNDRLCNHRCDAIRPGNENNRLYKRMRKIGLGNLEIIPLLSRTCDRKTIREVERMWVRVLGADLNSYLPIREEETLEEYMTSYRQKNKEVISQQKNNKNNKKERRYYCSVCEIAFESKRNLERHFDTLKHSYAWLNSVD